MQTLRILFIGGTGTISEACTRLAAAKGLDLTLLNRGQREASIPAGVKTIRADVRDRAAYSASVTGREFDVVVDWIAYTSDHVEADIEVFRGRVRQYVFISSASAYQKPPAHYVVTESTPLENPYWEYSRNKIACEERLMRAYREEGFPVTIVRPSYTYGPALVPAAVVGGGYTAVDRMRRGKEIVVHGDGTSLWTMTHNTDFAKGFNGLLGHPQAKGEAFHITSDEVLTWNQIYAAIGAAAGVTPRLVHIPTDFIASVDPGVGASLLGDKAWSLVFDNAKVKHLVPDFVATKSFASGVRESVAWFDADPARRKTNDRTDEASDRIISAFRKSSA
jgi:nucleoside-diphosphate-sugar epimerase